MDALTGLPKDFYDGCCLPGTLPALAADDDFDRIAEDIARQLHEGRLPNGRIPMELYQATASRLVAGLYDGLGAKSFDYGSPNNSLLAHLQHNIYAFSAAKSLAEIKAFRGMLTDETGQLRSFAQFRDAVAKSGAVFNKTHLQTEYNNAVSSAEMAALWNSFPEDAVLEISTAGDNRVRKTHALLDGITAPKSDPLWRRIWPPFDWNCRCTVIPGLESNVKAHNTGQLTKEAKVSKYFQNNTGISRAVFDDGHPYFIDSFGKRKELTAERVYGLPSPQQLFNSGGFPSAAKMSDKAAAENWWAEEADGLRGFIDVEDVNGVTLRFDKKFRKHAIEDNNDERWAFLSNLRDIVQSPDEVWSIEKDGRVFRTYIKWYEDYPIAVYVDGQRPYTMLAYEKAGKKGVFNEASMIADRQGILLYRKN